MTMKSGDKSSGCASPWAQRDKPVMRALIAVLWPSFLVAILAEGVFFSLFDPAGLVLPALEEAPSPLAVYAIGFLFFWMCGSLSAALGQYLSAPVPERIEHNK
jgi:hypothetical protein